MQTAAGVLGALVLVVLASDAFTNAVEWFASIRGLTRNAAGAVVAAIGSSLPETMIVIVALLVLRDPQSQAVGIGAVLGAPFMLATVVFAIIGCIARFRGSVYRQTGGSLAVEPRAAISGLSVFALTFALILGASFAPTLAARTIAAIAVIIAYIGYLVYQFRGKGGRMRETPPPLRFAPRSKQPSMWVVIAQMVLALAVTVAASRWFVASVTGASAQAGIPPLVVSLFVSPIATELPEAMNVILWMRRGEDELAIGNVLGAMIFQTSIASAIAMLASPWRLDAHAYAACLATAAAVVTVLLATASIRRLSSVAMIVCGLYYVGYVIFAWTAR